MPPSSTSSKRAGKKGHKTSAQGSAKKKGSKRSHEEFSTGGDGEDVEASLSTIADDSDDLLAPSLSSSTGLTTMDLQMQSDDSDQRQLTVTSPQMLLQPQMSLSSPSLHSPPVQTVANLSFQYLPTTFVTYCNASLSQKSFSALDINELRALCTDLHAMQKDAKERALRIESELRKLADQRADGVKIESESYYQEAIKWLHGIDVSEEVLGEDPIAGSNEIKKKSRSHSTDDDAFTPRRGPGKPRKPHRKGAGAGTGSSAAGGTGGQVADESLDSDGQTSKQKTKSLTAKERQLGLREFWDGVDQYFGFPNEEQCQLVAPQSYPHLFTIPPAGQHWNHEQYEQRWKEERDRDREKEKEKERQKDKERSKKERKKEKERKEREKEKDKEKERQREQRKLAEAQRLNLLYLDDPKLRRSIVETDKALSVDKSLFTHSLTQRLLACFIEQPATPQRPLPIPYITTTTPLTQSSNNKKKDKDKTKKKDKQNSPNLYYSLEGRIRMELRAVGLLTDADIQSDLQNRTDDEISAALRAGQSELKQQLSHSNPVRASLHPLAVRISDHTQRLQLLQEAEGALQKVYKKKRVSDSTAEKAVEGFVETQQRVGTRSRITGFIAHPQDMKGVPRKIADAVVHHPTYGDVLMGEELPPLQAVGEQLYGAAGGYRNYGRLAASTISPYRGESNITSLPLPGRLPSPAYSPTHQQNSQDYETVEEGDKHPYSASPLPNYPTHHSPINLSPPHSPTQPVGAGGISTESEVNEATNGVNGMDLYEGNISMGEAESFSF